jgi:hypothetical protein
MPANDRVRRSRYQLRRAVDERYKSVDGSWRRYFRGGVYIPAVSRQQLGNLESRSPSDIRAELERLATLGSPWASALLAYESLLLRPDGTRDIDRAISLCKESASRGDAYAQYIMYWASLLKGDGREASQYLTASVGNLFPPAVLDSINLTWLVRQKTDPSAVVRSIGRARDVGHYGALYWRYKLYATGKLGLWRIPVGYSCLPLGALLYTYGGWRYPFSARVFAFDATAKVHPLLIRR